MSSLTATLTATGLSASLSGKIYVNDYTVTISQIADGYRLTVARGSEVQTADMLTLSADEIESIRGEEAQRAAAEAIRIASENARISAEESRETAEISRQAAEAERVAADAKRDPRIAALEESQATQDTDIAALKTGKQDTLTDTDKQAIADLHADKVTDVTANGASLVSGTVADIPVAVSSATGTSTGLITLGNYASSGIYVPYKGANVRLYGATEYNITNRQSNPLPITPTTLNFAVKAALTDDKRDTGYTDAQKEAACDTIGAATAASVTEQKAEIDGLQSDLTAETEARAALQTELSEEIERAKATDEHHSALIDELFKDSFDGTKKTYKRLMREWFLDNGAETATPAELTALCDEWYSRSRTGWNGYTTFAQPDVSTASTGTKGGDNADMICVPSTNDTAGQDDYAGLPQFAVKDCNWIVTDDGDIQITAIDGITSNFERYNPEVYVGVLQMSMLHYWYEDDTSYTHGLTDDLSDTSYDNVKPYPEAIKLDGTVRSWVCHGKYMSQEVNGKMTCCAGLVPSESLYSHNALATKSKVNGAYYSGGTVTDWSFLVLMAFIKYGSMSLDGIIQGCVSYYNQIPVSVASDNVNYVIVSNSNADKILIGSTVRIGSSNTYGNAASYDISGRYGRIVESKEAYDDSNTAIHVSGDAISTLTTSYVTTYHWQSGSNDSVLGNDGGCVSSTNGECAGKLQGIEFAVGGYEVFGDVILYLDGENYCPYVVRDASKQKTGATITTAGYADSGLRSAQPDKDSWNYIENLNYSGEIFFAGGTSNGSSSKFCKDAFYKNSVNSKQVYREWLAFGALSYGSGSGGLSCLIGTSGLGSTSWYFLARLSPNGNRGELTA